MSWRRPVFVDNLRPVWDNRITPMRRARLLRLRDRSVVGSTPITHPILNSSHDIEHRDCCYFYINGKKAKSVDRSLEKMKNEGL